MKNGTFEYFFPTNYSHISKIIFTNTTKFEPNLTTYNRQFNVSDKEFMDILIENLINESNKGNFDLIKNKTKKDLIADNLNKINIQDIYDFIFKINDTKYSFFNLDEIQALLQKKLENKKKILLDELKFDLFNDGNLFFFNNGNKVMTFNYNKFKSFNIDEFYNNNYFYENCFKENINIKREKTLTDKIENNIKLNKKNLYNIENTIIQFINDKDSLNYFESRAKYFEILSIDIEGSFQSDNIRINLIQICNDTNLKNDIYVIDFNTFKNMEKEIFLKLSNLLKNLFENKKIKKIFFDGRSDLLSLHKELNICAKNVIDLSSLYNAVNSYKEQYQFKILKGDKNEKNFNQCFKLCKQNYYFKGLNTVLKEFHTNHCINPLKDKYHKLFKEKEFEYWAPRPIINEFLLYSALDVKYEFDTYNNLKNELKKILMKFYEINDINENNIDLVILLISFWNHKEACNSFKDIKSKLVEIK